MKARVRTRARARRGSSLIEVLIAFAIMSLLMVGILQMFSIALVVNQGASARTTLLFKCQQVVENLRYYYFLANRGLTTPDGATMGPSGGLLTGIPFPMPTGTTPTVCSGGAGVCGIPYDATDVRWAFWGPTGANVMEVDKGPYKISYSIVQDPATNVFVITVSAIPTDVAGASRRFYGVGVSRADSGGALINPKRVDYVAQF